MVIRKITKKTSETEPYQIWNAFVDILANEPFEGLSPVQKTASLCFWYDSEVQNGGHFQYFENTATDRVEQTVSALISLGAIKYSEILKVALQKQCGHKNSFLSVFDFSKKAMEGRFDALDKQYHGCSPALVELMKEFLDKHQSDFVKII